MGLDMYLFKKSLNIKEQIINRLEDTDGYKEVIYWRKNNIIHRWFCENFEVENCEYIQITKEDILNLIVYLEDIGKDDISIDETYYQIEDKKEDIEKLKELLEKIDWENEELYYYAWW